MKTTVEDLKDLMDESKIEKSDNITEILSIKR